MNENTLEAFERDVEKQRAKLLRDIELARALPTTGKGFTWTGEDGWDKDGKPKPSREKEIQLTPWIVHDLTAYRHSEHVAFKAPDSSIHNKQGEGEHVSSQYRSDFEARYYRAVCDAFKASRIGVAEVKGSRYTGFFPEGFDYTTVKDYSDAELHHEAGCILTVSSHLGAHSYSSARLEFYAMIEGRGRVKVSMELPGLHALYPRPHNIQRNGLHGDVTSVGSWITPDKPIGYVSHKMYISDSYKKLGCTIHWLFDDVDSVLALAFPPKVEE